MATPETVTLAGSGLVFENTYAAGVSADYRAAVIEAENLLQSHFTNAVTVRMNFDLQPIDPKFSAQNQFAVVAVTYDQFASALASHATTADDLIAVAGLPAADPSHGLGFWLSGPQARVLGLATDGPAVDDTVVVNSTMQLSHADLVGVIEHEISEGVFGRVSSLGLQRAGWQPMDLFRFDVWGNRDYTGGADGARTYFGLDGDHLSPLRFHNSISASGADDGFDLADWDRSWVDAFGAVGPGSEGQLSATDIQVLDVLGWTPNPAARLQPVVDHGQASLAYPHSEPSLFSGWLAES
jgi:hypothetical protein